MEENNELSDILLEQKSSGNATKIKRLIVIVVLLILLFILVIMIMKFINKSDDTSSTLTDPMLVNTPPENIIDEPSNFSVDENLSYVDENLTVDYNTISNESGITVIANDSVDVSPKVIEQPIVVTPPPSTTPPPKKVAQKPTAQKLAVSDAKSVLSGHYIQVGAFSGTPDKKFIDKISKAGYKYQIQKINVAAKSVTKVLVGPYNSRAETDKEMTNIKNNLAKDAFYMRIQ